MAPARRDTVCRNALGRGRVHRSHQGDQRPVAPPEPRAPDAGLRAPLPRPAHAGARPPAAASVKPVSLVRIISRLNVGGPAIHVITLTRRLEALGYWTTLVRGRESPNEGNMDHLAAELRV